MINEREITAHKYGPTITAKCHVCPFVGKNVFDMDTIWF